MKDVKLALVIAAVVYGGAYLKQNGLPSMGSSSPAASSTGDPSMRLAALCRRAAQRIPGADKLADNGRLWECWNAAVDAEFAGADRAAVLQELEAIDQELEAAIGVPDVDKPPAAFDRAAAAAVFQKHGAKPGGK